MALKPLGDRILVSIVEAEAKTASGILIPETAQQKPSEAIVVSVGPTAQDIKIGDKVVFSKYGGTEVLHEDKTFLLLSYKDVLAVIE